MEFLLILAVILGLVSGIGSLVCFIIVLTRLFPAEGGWKGLFGLICSLYAFVWGWQNKDAQRLQTVMPVWTVLIVLGLILNVFASTL
jgi:hypothetical protein